MKNLVLTFETGHSRQRRAMRDFYLARDRFLHEQLRRRTAGGVRFASYRAPDGSDVDCFLTSVDLRQHALVLGATGTGKSSLLSALARTCFHRGQGFALIDPHGDLFTRAAVFTLQRPDTVFLDFTQPDVLPAWNPLERIPEIEPARQVSALVGILSRLYADERAASWAWGVKVSQLARMGVTALVESERPATLLDLPRFFLSPKLRREVLATAGPETQAFFKTRYGAREQMYVDAFLNKVEPFLEAGPVRAFLGKPTSDIDLPRLVDRGGTLLVNLASGYLGPSVAAVLGRLLLNVCLLAALRRERQAPESRVPFSILVDEAHDLAATESGLEELLVAARKYRVYLALAAQGLSLFPSRFQPHLLGNTGRQFLFRLPFGEARLLAPDLFEPLGTVPREPVRHYDAIEDPRLKPEEELLARTKELANLPTGHCYWALKGRRFKARRIRVLRPQPLPMRVSEVRTKVRHAMARLSGNATAAPTENDSGAFVTGF